MNIAIIGYGKMGKAIEQIAINRGHTISFKINSSEEISQLLPENTDVAVEFTSPESGFENIKAAISKDIPVVSGTTGWLEHYDEIKHLTLQNEGAFFYASNFSVGVNIFFKLNKKLAEVMNQFDAYRVKMEEIHHTQKLDAPSGTAITLAEGIIEKSNVKTEWLNEATVLGHQLEIISKRIENVPGTHTISYESDVDSIEIKHTAHNRTGFATGAVMAAEFISDRKGVFGMDDLLDFSF